MELNEWIAWSRIVQELPLHSNLWHIRSDENWKKKHCIFGSITKQISSGTSSCPLMLPVSVYHDVVTCGVMCAVITHSSSTSEVFLGLRVHAGIIVAGSRMTVTLAGPAVIRLHLIPRSERLVIEERCAALTLSKEAATLIRFILDNQRTNKIETWTTSINVSHCNQHIRPMLIKESKN